MGLGSRGYVFGLYCLYGFINSNVSTELHLPYFVESIRNIADVTPRTSAPVGAPRRPESPSGGIAAGRASLR
jgi:hypothetical protein